VLDDVLRAVDSDDLAVLTLLDLSAAFDTVDHATLLRRQHVTYVLVGVIINWFTSYPDGRTQSVRSGHDSSKTLPLLFDVPQRLILMKCFFLN